MPEFIKDRECLWITKSQHCRNKPARENTLYEIVHYFNFSELTVEDVKLKMETIRTRYAAELAKVIKSENKKWCRIQGRPRDMWASRVD
jgi:hypothetical protein